MTQLLTNVRRTPPAAERAIVDQAKGDLELHRSPGRTLCATSQSTLPALGVGLRRRRHCAEQRLRPRSLRGVRGQPLRPRIPGGVGPPRLSLTGGSRRVGWAVLRCERLVGLPYSEERDRRGNERSCQRKDRRCSDDDAVSCCPLSPVAREGWDRADNLGSPTAPEPGCRGPHGGGGRPLWPRGIFRCPSPRGKNGDGDQPGGPKVPCPPPPAPP